MTTTTETRTRRRWVVPATAVAIGVVYLVAGLRGGDEQFAWVGLGLMVGIAVVAWLVSLRSETIAGLLSRKDERINAIDRDASLFSGMTLILVVLGAFVVEIARGLDGQPWSLLGAVAGLAYVVALVWLRFRR
jgi:prepilin signal peptidase PulO-like enzyme (type II secretory pathway)